MKNLLLIIGLATLLVSACKKDEKGGGVIVVPPVITVDTILYKVMPFPMGAALGVNLMKNNTKYNGVVTKEYNSITAENAMKVGALHPAENTYNWADADYLVDYAQANGKRVHGHTLVWYTSLPT